MIADKIRQIKLLFERIEAYDKLITSDNFEPATVDDMKGNAKDICDQAKIEINGIKAEIDQWS